jgi:hypothetical protein
MQKSNVEDSAWNDKRSGVRLRLNEGKRSSDRASNSIEMHDVNHSKSRDAKGNEDFI